MKIFITSLAAITAFAFGSCERKSDMEKAVDDIGDAAEEVADEVGDAARAAE